MTENEAKTKWCPQVRFADPRDGGKPSVEPTSWNRFDGEWDFTGLLCIASDCMMWRWNIDPLDHPHDYDKTGGYCGLGGRP